MTLLDFLPTNAFTTWVRALHTRLSRTSARWPRYSSLRARARRVQPKRSAGHACAWPCQRTELQPTRARPTAVSRLNDGQVWCVRWDSHQSGAGDARLLRWVLQNDRCRQGLKPRNPKIRSTRLWHSLNVPLAGALLGRSLAEFGFFVLHRSLLFDIPGWGGGRNLAGAVPAFDPHPSLPPARGKEHFPLAAALTTCRATNVSPRTTGPARGLGGSQETKRFAL